MGAEQVWSLNDIEGRRNFAYLTKLHPQCAECWWGLARSYAPNINRPVSQADFDQAAERALSALSDDDSIKVRVLVMSLQLLRAEQLLMLPNTSSSVLLAESTHLERYADKMCDAADGVLAADPDVEALCLDARISASVWSNTVNEVSDKESGPSRPPLEAFAARLDKLLANSTALHPLAQHLALHLSRLYEPTARGAYLGAPRAQGAGSGSFEVRQAHARSSAHQAVLEPFAHPMLPQRTPGRVTSSHVAPPVSNDEDPVLAADAYIDRCLCPPGHAQHLGMGIWHSLIEGNYSSAQRLAGAAKRLSVSQAAGRCDAAAVGKHNALQAPLRWSFNRQDKWSWLVQTRFGRWDRVLALGSPACLRTLDAAARTACMASLAWRYYAHGMALIATGGRADDIINQLSQQVDQQGPRAASPALPSLHDLDASRLVRLELEGRQQLADGDARGAAAKLFNLTQLLSHLTPSDPPLYYYQAYDCLGHVHYINGELDKAISAFRKSLEQKRSGWALKGLELAHAAKGRHAEAAAYRAEYFSAWVNADVALTSACPQFDSLTLPERSFSSRVDARPAFTAASTAAFTSASTAASTTALMVQAQTENATNDDHLATQNLAGHVDPVTWAYDVIYVCSAIAFLLLCFDVCQIRRGYLTATSKQDVEKLDDDGKPALNPRRNWILALCVLSVFGSDVYIGMPTSYFVGEAGLRYCTTVAADWYFSVFPLTGFLTITFFGSMVLERIAANQLNRISLLLSAMTAALQGLASLFDPGRQSEGPFLVTLITLRLIEGAPSRSKPLLSSPLVWGPNPSPASSPGHAEKPVPSEMLSVPSAGAGIPGSLTEMCANTMIMRSFPTKELPDANGIFIASRLFSQVIGNALGSTLYSAGGFPVPYMFGGLVLVAVYFVIRLTLAREDSMSHTPKNDSPLVILNDWRAAACAFTYATIMFNLNFMMINVQLWIAAEPYNANTTMVSTVLITISLSLVAGIGITQALIPRIGFVACLPGCALLILFGHLMMGPNPPAFPGYPQTVAAAYGAIIPAVLGFAPLATFQPLASYILSKEVGLSRESINAPIGAVFIGGPLIGIALAPIVNGTDRCAQTTWFTPALSLDLAPAQSHAFLLMPTTHVIRPCGR